MPEGALGRRVAMIGSGSRGDLQTLVALGKGLAAAGHDVTVATHRSFESLVSANGLAFRRLSGDSEQFFKGIGGITLREKWRNPLSPIRFANRFLGPFMDRLFTESLEVSRDADAVLYWPFLRIGPTLEETVKVPCFAVAHYPMPYLTTGDFPNAFFSPWPRLERSRFYNRFTYAAARPFFWRLVREQLQRWRQSLGLKPLSTGEEAQRVRRIPHLLGFSQSVLPRPKDWPRDTHATGYWFLDAGATESMPPALEAFLAGGPAPVCIGFGSMTGRKPVELTELALEALRLAGMRGVLLTGWGGLQGVELPDSVFATDAVSHDLLYPHMSAVVHHGGSGTTAAAVRAGVPQIITPFGFDQALWGRRITHLGIGPALIPHTALTAERLATAIREVTTSDSMRTRAAELGRRVREEDGVARAIELLNDYAARGIA
ncbi:MAG: glycosyltransferase [Acidobacteriota bacterium]